MQTISLSGCKLKARSGADRDFLMGKTTARALIPTKAQQS
jgi:hypothetical protein